MNPITLETRLQHQPQILEQQADDTLVLLTLQGGCYYALEGAGRRAWTLCDGRRTVADIAALLGREYDAPAQVIGSDLLALFTDLAHEHLVHAHP